MGMSLALTAAVSTIGLCWLTTKAPRFAALVALRRFDELDMLFFQSLKQALMAGIACAGVMLALGVFLHEMRCSFAARILPPWPLLFLLLANIVSLLVAAEATYLRAFKREPFLSVAIANAVLNALFAVVFAVVGNVSQIAFGYFAINMVVGLGLGTAVFRAKRRLWRHEWVLGKNTV